MIVEELNIPGLLLFQPKRFEDNRGYFMESYNAETLSREGGLDVQFVQDNESFSARSGTVRGLHLQSAPHGQGKLIRCSAGRIKDVAVDVRIGSPTYGAYVAVELSHETGKQIWIPPGFLHGFVTLEDKTTVQYKTTGTYNPDASVSVYWKDPSLNIDWGIEEQAATLSEADKAGSPFKAFKGNFVFERKT